MCSFPESEGTIGCIFPNSSKFYNNVFLFAGLITLGTFIEFWLVCSLVECPNVSITKCNLWRGYFVFQHWGCTWIYRPLSYPFGSLASCTVSEYHLHIIVPEATASCSRYCCCCWWCFWRLLASCCPYFWLLASCPYFVSCAGYHGLCYVKVI